MEIKAQLRHLRISPRKVRLVTDLIRGMDAGQAQSQLKFLPKKSATYILKLVESAIANAKNNFGITDKNNLFIKEIKVDQGPTLKRWRARAMGRAGAIKKKTSHVSLILGEKVASTKKIKQKSTKTEFIKKIDKHIHPASQTDMPKPQSAPEQIARKDEKKPPGPDIRKKRKEFSKQGVARKFFRLGNKIFRRKSI